jgi:cation transport protein ChaC
MTEQPLGAGSGADEGPLWVFAYGSLMWQPGFPYRKVEPALLRGYHRSFCIYSHHYRGTPDQPGLVLGLARGGSCRGLAFEVAAPEAAAVRAYLDERELVSYAYRAKMLPVRIAAGPVPAYTFVADPQHRQYAGALPVDQAAALIIGAQGCAGLNRDYLINTVRQLEDHGFTDRRLHALLKRVEFLTGVIEAGSGI